MKIRKHEQTDSVKKKILRKCNVTIENDDEFE